MIPKIIHYCWFGQGEMPELVQKCIASWYRFMPDWEYRLWTEDSLKPILNMPTPNSSLEGGGQTPLINPPTKEDEDWLEFMPAYVSHSIMALDVYNKLDKKDVSLDYMLTYSLGGDLARFSKCRRECHKVKTEEFIDNMWNYMKDNKISILSAACRAEISYR